MKSRHISAPLWILRRAAWCGIVWGGCGLAQTHKVTKTERVTRAIGVYEWTGPITKPTAARLIPVSIFLDGHLQDAGVYLARPVPLALESGDVYSVERAGEHLGTLDIDSAKDIATRSAASDESAVTAWFGYGRFLTPEAEPKPQPSKTTASPSAVVSSVADSGADDRPHYTVRQTSPAPDAAKDGSTKPVARPAVDDDDDRPTLRKRDPEDAKKKRKKSDGDSGVFGPKTSLNDDPDRPTMRRGAPESAIFTAALSGMPADLHQAVAVSDAATRETHEFARSWESPAEHDAVLAQMQGLARARVGTYAVANGVQVGSAKTAAPGTTAKTPVARTAHPVAVHPAAAHPRAVKAAAVPVSLTNDDLRGYTLSYGGSPTFVYAAEAHATNGATIYVTVVAQRLPSGELQVALASTTDARHLDRVPWMRPIDAVDPDAGHRASLLFELRGQTSRQFALYRLVTAQAEQSFVSGILP